METDPDESSAAPLNTEETVEINSPNISSETLEKKSSSHLAAKLPRRRCCTEKLPVEIN